MKRRLITSALPYVNNIPHLGNLIQVLSADVFARFCRLRGYETCYICGTDEYGTATETKAMELGITPIELCDRYHTIHADIYKWLHISFDKFGRTSTPAHTEITQSVFTALYERGYISSQKISQLYSEASQLFLADRYIIGICPHCHYERARGDQCENCGTLLEPTELIEPRSTIDDSVPVIRETEHLYINLPALRDTLVDWVKKASKKGHWAHNALKITEAWIRDGLKQRAITRDLRWGIPVPLDQYKHKVFYVWFDAPIGYMSITATLTDDWQSWWKNPEHVELFQFIGKDNIPFHSVVFPSTLLGTGESWTMLHHISSSEYLTYEGGSFSKSAGIGIFADQARETGIPADVWRFYLMYNRPETSDYHFSWPDFQQHVNGELIGNFSNLINRTLSFVHKYLDGKIGTIDREDSFWKEVRTIEERITKSLEHSQLRAGLRDILRLCDLGNQYFQSQEPWQTRKSDVEATIKSITNLVYLIRDLAVLTTPYMPHTAQRIATFLGLQALSWDMLASENSSISLQKVEKLFSYLEDAQILAFRTQYSGIQESSAERFARCLDVRSAKIISVEMHPHADRLYMLTLDDGSTHPRSIVSGLVEHYSVEELTGKMILLVANLKPAKIRGVQSKGMLLAASEGKALELIIPEASRAGLPVLPKDMEVSEAPHPISYENFAAIPLRISEGKVMTGDTELFCNGQVLCTSRISHGEVS